MTGLHHEPAIKWAIDTLMKQKYRIMESRTMIVQNTAWSKVCRFHTDRGVVFLKIVPPKLSLEPNIIEFLEKEFQATVPHVIATHPDLYCFLMKDAGISLHDYFKHEFQDEVFINVLHNYALLQIKTSEVVQQFIDKDVPDWRLENLPALYDALIAQETLLLNDGLNKDEIYTLKKLTTTLILYCEKLAQFNIRNTFGHADFHDKNILIDVNTQQTTMIDLGEVVITYPFFSFLDCLHRAKENFNLSDHHYEKLCIACFQPWLSLESQENILKILNIIQYCWPIHAVLGEYRLIQSVSSSAQKILQREGRFAKKLRVWINQHHLNQRQ